MAASPLRSRPNPSQQWLDRIRAPEALRDVAVGLRGFFLADPDELSLLALADQFAEDGAPGSEKMFRIVGGNDRLPALLAKTIGPRLRLQTTLRRVTQTHRGITAALESKGRVDEARFDYLVCAMPATTVRDVVFEPALPEFQRQAVTNLKYGAATKTALQFDRTPWRRRGKPRAFGTPLPIGAVWDGNEEQIVRVRRSAATARQGGILTLLAGGGASAATREMLAAGGPARVIRELSWLNLKHAELRAWTTLSWENEKWSRGGYAFFDPQFPPSLRYWLARPFDRIFFAGEHTSLRWQGYMNGAVETGLRAAEEISRQSQSPKSKVQSRYSGVKMAKVGVIGLGAMGAPMAQRLVRAGHSVTVFARRAEQMAPLIGIGARWRFVSGGSCVAKRHHHHDGARRRRRRRGCTWTTRHHRRRARRICRGGSQHDRS